MACCYLLSVYLVFIVSLPLSPSVVCSEEMTPRGFSLSLCSPNSATDSSSDHNSDFASLLLTMSLGLPPIANFSIPLLSSCHAMSLLRNMILLPSNLPAYLKCKNSDSSSLCRALIVLLLMISGNVHVNPGPPDFVPYLNGPQSQNLCFNKFCNRNCIGFLHVNVRSLVPKMDQLKVWVESSNPHVLVITETWLRKSVPYPDTNITGYNLFRQDRSSKGGGVAIYSKEHLHCSVVYSKSIPKQFDLLVIQIRLAHNLSITVAGCYRPPSAPACTLEALSCALAPFTKSEFVLLGDLNWDMLKPPEKVTQPDPHKSAGCDDLPAFFIKTAAPIIAAPITAIFNLSLDTAEIPSDWKEAPSVQGW